MSSSPAPSVASSGVNPNVEFEQTSRLDWNLLVPAVLSKLIAVVLAIACGILAYAAWRVLHQALAGPVRPASPSDPLPEDGPFAFQRHWGGFGGSSTGWTVSERLVRVIVGLVLAALAVSLGMQLVPQETGRDDKGKPGPEAAASAVKQGK
jgi:protein-S-isoprenylcysteine O-methyltransferase Ste14